MSQTIQTAKAAPAIGPYSQAVSCKGLLFTSGQILADAEKLSVRKFVLRQNR